MPISLCNPKKMYIHIKTIREMKGNSSSSSIPWEEKTGQTAFLFPLAAPIAGSVYFSCAHTQTDADAAVAVWCVWSAGRYFCVSRVASNRVVNSLLIFNRKSHRRWRRRKLSRRVPRERLESARPPFANYEFYKRPRRHRFLLFIFALPPPIWSCDVRPKEEEEEEELNTMPSIIVRTYYEWPADGVAKWFDKFSFFFSSRVISCSWTLHAVRWMYM